MAQKRNTRGAAATAVAPSASPHPLENASSTMQSLVPKGAAAAEPQPPEPVLKWRATLANGHLLDFQMTNSELCENMNAVWFQLDSGMILVVENIVMIGVQGKV